MYAGLECPGPTTLTIYSSSFLPMRLQHGVKITNYTPFATNELCYFSEFTPKDLPTRLLCANVDNCEEPRWGRIPLDLHVNTLIRRPKNSNHPFWRIPSAPYPSEVSSSILNILIAEAQTTKNSFSFITCTMSLKQTHKRNIIFFYNIFHHNYKTFMSSISTVPTKKIHQNCLGCDNPDFSCISSWSLCSSQTIPVPSLGTCVGPWSMDMWSGGWRPALENTL